MRVHVPRTGLSRSSVRISVVFVQSRTVLPAMLTRIVTCLRAGVHTLAPRPMLLRVRSMVAVEMTIQYVAHRGDVAIVQTTVMSRQITAPNSVLFVLPKEMDNRTVNRFDHHFAV